MASITLSQSSVLSQNELIQGVIENIITVNRMFEIVPFDGIEGNALAYNRELVLGDAQFAGVDDAIIAKNAATFTQVTSSLTTLLGDAEVNGLIQATRSNINDQKAIQVASKAKSVGRQFQNTMINGTGSVVTATTGGTAIVGGTGTDFPGLLALCDVSQTLGVGQAQTGTAQVNGGALSFEDLDALIDLVVDKDGQVDYLTMQARTMRSYLSLLRQLGGATIDSVVQLPSGAQVPAYRGIPIFRNDYIPVNQTVGTSTKCTTVFAGTLDDGSRSHGIAGLTAESEAGIQVVDVGESEFKDNNITRVKWYTGMACFSLKGLAMLNGVTN